MNREITFIIPCRNNLPYLQQAVKSIHTYYQTKYDIIILDDASDDGTVEWVENVIRLHGGNNGHIHLYKNETGERVGHTVLYDIGISMALTPIVTILHSDMVVTKDYIENLRKHIRPGVVVSATRIEPPLHPPGPEKIVKHFGFEPDEFEKNKTEFDAFVESQKVENNNRTTRGIFAPWMIYKDDFVAVGGHDRLFAPMELEDSDIFNRFVMNGYELIQSRDSFVYHMTCRGSRFKDGIEIEREIPLPDGTVWYKPVDSKEYLDLRAKKFREWWRKWHSNVMHDSMMMPIVPTVYKTQILVRNCNERVLHTLEPFSDEIGVDCDIDSYIKEESKNTLYDLTSRVKRIDGINSDYHIRVTIDANNFTQSTMDVIANLPFVIENSGETKGRFSVESLTIDLNLPEDRSSIVPILPVFKNIF